MKYLTAFTVFFMMTVNSRASADTFSFDSKVDSSESGHIEFLVKSAPSSKQSLFSSKTLGIGLELPSDSEFELSEGQKNGGAVYRLTWERVKGRGESAGACGNFSEKSLSAERAVLEKAKSSSDVEKEFEKTRFARHLQFLKNGGLNIVFGMSKCLGHMEKDEKIGDSAVPFFAVFFHKGWHFMLEMHPDFRQTTAGEFEDVTDDIASGKSRAPAAKQWAQFKQIVNSLKLVR